MGSAPILELKNISKSFPGVRALNRLNLKIESGKVHILVGGKRSGKIYLNKNYQWYVHAG